MEDRDRPRLAEAPSRRYAPADRQPRGGGDGTALAGPLARAGVVALAGAVALVFVGSVLASTAGLLFVSGLAGGGIGLVLARAAAPREDTRVATPRRTVSLLAVALALGAVSLAATATWLIAGLEGGTLGLVEYLLATFGPFVPAEAVIASLAAWWGATSGPVQA